jgi:hypothetical protein
MRAGATNPSRNHKTGVTLRSHDARINERECPMRVHELKSVLLACGVSAVLSACGGGASSVSSPGEGQFSAGTSVGGTGGSTGGTGGSGGAAASCPQGFSDLGTLANATLRNCGIPQLVLGDLTIPFRAGTVYSVNGRVEVGEDRGPNPAAPLAGRRQGILRIEPGVRIFGSTAEYIVVTRGSQIYAQGTASNPIVLTSRESVLGSGSARGQWGGLVVLGRAPQATCPAGATPPSNSCEANVEGVTGQLFGGTTADDSSGVLRYVRVQNSGFVIGNGNELNGITFAGVGRGTTAEYLQVNNSADDGIEIFGGTLNLRYLVLTNNNDDSLDTDTGWNGAAQFVLVQQGSTDDNGSRGFEMSSAGNQALRSKPQIANFTLIGTPTNPNHDAIVLNTGTSGRFINGVVRTENPAGSCVRIDDAATVSPTNDPPQFHSVVLHCLIGGAPAAFRGNTGSGGAAGAQAVFKPTENGNRTGFTNTLTSGFVNGAGENGVTAVNPATFNPFFTTTNYVGAVRDSNDTWWQGWTCGLPGQGAC